MMNRSTQRELIKLLLQFSETLPQIDFGADEQKNMALDILETVAGKYRQDFSKAKADEYTDTMQALSQIIQTTDWHQQGRAENIQCNTLCQDIILQLVENLRHEKEIKKDIVFLPYKASMWDSLESVWKAAYEDKEHCNAYVIPIPYADLNPDRSVAAWHCERDQYPKYVPTLDWREIDLEKWHPDIIFIHNPYDNYNYITSVDSMFYSSNLKKYTDNLVYVPYFVTGGKTISDHFCITPGVLNADHVICESEEIREFYERNHRIIAPYSKSKFLALGSPKYDKVVSAKKEDYPIPRAWEELIAGRKIILYNTSLSPLLQTPNSVIDKLKKVLSYFKNRRDVVLWWRPHPLLEATFDSMVPDLAKEYLVIRDTYLSENWGIYDNTSELDRAIIWSDAYYGERSSVVWLYRKTRKAIMLQESRLNPNIYHGLDFGQMDITADKGWFVTWSSFYGLYEYDFQKKQVTYLAEVPAEYNMDFEYSDVICLNNHVYIAPNYSKTGFQEFDLKKKRFQSVGDISMFETCGVPGSIAAFGNSCKFDNRAFFVGNLGGVITEINEKREFVYHTAWSKGLLREFGKDGLNFALHSILEDDGKIYLCCADIPVMVIIELQTFNMNWYKIPVICMKICKCKSHYVLLPKHGGKVLVWTNKKSFLVNTYIGENIENPYCGCFEIDNKIILIPANVKGIIELMISDGQIKYSGIKKSDKQYNVMFSKEKCKLLLDKKFENLVEISMDDKKRVLHYLKIPPREMASNYNKSLAFQKRFYTWEGAVFSLDDWLMTCMKHIDYHNRQGSIGKKIYDYLMKS